MNLPDQSDNTCGDIFKPTAEVDDVEQIKGMGENYINKTQLFEDYRAHQDKAQGYFE